VLDRVIVASGRELGQNEADGSNHNASIPPPNYGMAREVVVLIALHSVLASFESALHTVNLVAESIRFATKIWRVREFDRRLFP
jgi:hypothetical protein